MAARNGRSLKQKGDAFERELADHLNAAIPDTIRSHEIRRAPLSGGGHADGTYDLTGTRLRLPHPVGDIELGVEAKRVEKLSFREALAQATLHRDRMAARGLDTSGLVPIVVTRRSREKLDDAPVILRLQDFLRLLGVSPR